MLGWAIVFLVCLGYFLNEVRRAPIIEDTPADDTEDTASDQKDARRYELPIASRHSVFR